MDSQQSLQARLITLSEELVAQQEAKLRRIGEAICPDLSLDDLYCPDDIPRLRSDPHFLYEHGVLAGLSAAAAAVRALLREIELAEADRRAGQEP
ncbi:MAG: hypothetical protein Q9Q40_12250 [Acidobacteriota bacterium]|nr:hypothetical protein [Acidobacteriota bacterium]MDQ7087422.1 hypothetical protein [Acidobacteriota bacterium]